MLKIFDTLFLVYIIVKIQVFQVVFIFLCSYLDIYPHIQMYSIEIINIVSIVQLYTDITVIFNNF